VNHRTVGLVFAKDGIELLRDRRTLFVNVILPVLLYPLLGIALIQILQLAKPAEEDWPRVAAAGMPEAFADILEGEAAADAETGERIGYRIVPLPDADVATMRELAEESTRLLEELEALEAEGSAPAEDGGDGSADEGEEGDGSRADLTLRRTEIRAELLARLRDHDLALALVGPDLPPEGYRPWKVHVLLDHAHPDILAVEPQVDAALQRWRERLRGDRVADAELPAEFLDPIDAETHHVATAAEAAKVRFAAIIPIILVLLAVSGGFLPACDLIAGESERGTLETLCSLPGDRRDIFVGKLLVVFVAGVATVFLNLCSLGITMAILGSALSQGTAAVGLDIGFGVLVLCFVTLLPLCVTLAAVSLGIAGIADSFKEAQNYLTPLMLVVTVPAMLALMPTIKTTYALDLLPVLGPVLALKEALQSPEIPWGHLVFTTASSLAIAVVVVGWSARLLDSERFLYPGLVRAGWGRFRRWGTPPALPGGLEAMGLLSIAIGCWLVSAGLLAEAHPFLRIAGPLWLGLFLPVVVHVALGNYNPARTLSLRTPSRQGWSLAFILAIPALVLSLGIGVLQTPLVPQEATRMEGLEEALGGILDAGGLPLLILAIAVSPGVCEEFLCRGTLLSSLRASLGTVTAIAVTSLIFAVIHLSPARFFPQLALGVVLAVMTLRSGSIVPAILLHALHNAAIAVAITTPWAPVVGYQVPPESDGYAAHQAAIAAAVGTSAIAVWILLRRPVLRAPRDG